MKIEKHNSHGMELVVTFTPVEAREFIEKLFKAYSLTVETKFNHYVTTPCEFEDDNDKWVPTDFTFQVEDGLKANHGCRAAYPCGKQEGHEFRCFHS